MDSMRPLGTLCFAGGGFVAGFVLGFRLGIQRHEGVIAWLVPCNHEEERLQKAKRQVVSATPHFPFKGIEKFYDIGGFLRKPDVFEDVIQLFLAHLRNVEIDSICGLDARGFVLGPILALRMKKPFFMVRKAGKMPNSVSGEKYGKEYNEQDSLCISKDSIRKGDRVVVIDDLVATGGTALASLQLIERLGGVCGGFACVIELKDLGARKRLDEAGFASVEIFSVVDEVDFEKNLT